MRVCLKVRVCLKGRVCASARMFEGGVCVCEGVYMYIHLHYVIPDFTLK